MHLLSSFRPSTLHLVRNVVPCFMLFYDRHFVFVEQYQPYCVTRQLRPALQQA